MRRWMRFALWALAAAAFVGVACAAQLGMDAREVEIALDSAGSTASGAGVEIDGGQVAIRAAGTYRVRGKLDGGQLLIEAGKDSEVTLILDGAEIAHPTDAAILVENAGSATIRLAEGSTNRVQSGAPVEISADAADEAASGGAIHAKDDLRIEGEGALAVLGYVNNGIHASNRLRISGGAIRVEAVNNGVKGKDGVEISGGRLEIRAGGDGIEADSEDGPDFGAIELSGGEISIESFGDGAQAATQIEVSGGNLRVRSGGGSAAAQSKHQEQPGPWGRGENWDRDAEEDAPSAKGLKAGTLLAVRGGEIAIDAADDALHCDGDLELSGGSIQLASGDDGVHADDRLSCSGGSLRVTASYEGMEANRIQISGGELDLTADDDGINANGGSSPRMGFGGRGPGGRGNPAGDREPPPGALPEAEASSEPLPSLCVSGGSVRVDAEGDGLDSNGDLRVEGGTVIVDGPSRSGNGALDSGSERGGACLVQGGTVLAIGASGMAERFDDASGQCSFRHNFAAELPAGTELRVLDAAGGVLIAHTSSKNFSSAVFSCPELKLGETYVLTAGEQRVEIELSETSTDSGRSLR